MNQQRNELNLRWIAFIFVYFFQLKCCLTSGFHPYDQRYPDVHLVPGRHYVDLCETPDKIPGECKPIQDCWTASYTYIQRASCQFYGNIELFCCPYQEIHNRESLSPVRNIKIESNSSETHPIEKENNSPESHAHPIKIESDSPARHVQPIEIENNSPMRHVSPIKIENNSPHGSLFNPLNVLINIVVPGLGSFIQSGTNTPSRENSASEIEVSKVSSYQPMKISRSTSTTSVWSHNYNNPAVTNHKPYPTRSTTSSWNQAAVYQPDISRSTKTSSKPYSISTSIASVWSQNNYKPIVINHKPYPTRSTTPSWNHSNVYQPNTSRSTTTSSKPYSTRKTTLRWSLSSTEYTTSRTIRPTVPSRRPRSTKQPNWKPSSIAQTTSDWRLSSPAPSPPRPTRITAFQPVLSTTTTKAPQKIYFTTRKPQSSRATPPQDLYPTSQPAAVCGRRRFISSRGSTSKPKLQAFILGGSNSDEQSWPWMASIHSWNQFGRSRFICGGSLITKRHILTAAHCFDNKNSVVRYTAVLGVTNLTLVSDEKSEFFRDHLRVSRIKFPDQYKERIYYHDIAILILEEDVTLNNRVSTICLPTTQDLATMNPQAPATVAGWGQTSFGGLSSHVLQDAELQIINFNRCQNSYDRFRTKSLPHGITSDMLCAGKPAGKGDACQGDSGGPLVIQRGKKWIQIGIVSFGYQCGLEEYPGVYTKVSSYLPWIQKILRGE